MRRDERAVANGLRTDGRDLSQAELLIVANVTEALRWIEEHTGRRFASPLTVEFATWPQWREHLARNYPDSKNPESLEVTVFSLFEPSPRRLLISPVTVEFAESDADDEPYEDELTWRQGHLAESIDICSYVLLEDAFGLVSKMRATTAREEKRVRRSLLDGHALLLQSAFLAELGVADLLEIVREEPDMQSHVLGHDFLKPRLDAGGHAALDAVLAGAPPSLAQLRSEGTNRRDEEERDRALPSDDVAFDRQHALEILASLAELRGVSAPADIDIVELAPTEFDEAHLDWFTRTHATDFVVWRVSLLVCLGVFDAEDAADHVSNFARTAAALELAFHDPWTDRVAVRKAAKIREQTLAKDLTRALADARFDARRLAPIAAPSHDVGQAWQALLEGDGLALAAEWRFGSPNRPYVASEADLEQQTRAEIEFNAVHAEFRSGHALAIPPAVGLQASGAGFVQALVRHGGWSAVDAAFERLPLSTEQVAHPSKYLAAPDWPVEIDVAQPEAWSLDGWTVTKRETLGELFLADFTAAPSDPRRAVEAAYGWDGDTLLLVERGDARAVLWALAFDSETDARQAATHLVSALRIGRLREGDTQRVRRRGDRHLAVGVEGTRVAVIGAADAERIDETLRALLEAPVTHHADDVSHGATDAAETQRLEARELSRLGGEVPIIEGRRVEVGDIGLVFEFPSDTWKRGADRRGIRAFFTRGDDQRVNFNLVANEGDIETLGELRAKALELMPQQVPGFAAEHEEVIEVAGEPAWRLDFTLRDERQSATVRQLTFLRGKKQIVLTCTFVGDAPDAATLAEFEALLMSARFVIPNGGG